MRGDGTDDTACDSLEGPLPLSPPPRPLLLFLLLLLLLLLLLPLPPCLLFGFEGRCDAGMRGTCATGWEWVGGSVGE